MAGDNFRHKTPIAFYLPLIVCVLLLLAVIYNSAALIYQLVKFFRQTDKPKD